MLLLLLVVPSEEFLLRGFSVRRGAGSGNAGVGGGRGRGGGRDRGRDGGGGRWLRTTFARGNINVPLLCCPGRVSRGRGREGGRAHLFPSCPSSTTPSKEARQSLSLRPLHRDITAAAAAAVRTNVISPSLFPSLHYHPVRQAACCSSSTLCSPSSSPPSSSSSPPPSSSSCHGDRRGRRWSGKHHSRTIATAAAGIPSLPLMMTSECRQGRWPTQGGRRRRGREGGRGGRGGRRGVAAVEDQVQRLRRAQIQRLRWGGRREEGNRRVYGMRVIKDNYQDTKPCMHPN